MVGIPGIEPGLHAPEACVLPLYYIPKIFNRAGCAYYRHARLRYLTILACACPEKAKLFYGVLPLYYISKILKKPGCDEKYRYVFRAWI